MKIIRDFVTNSSEPDYYSDCYDCDCRDCSDCDCDYDCSDCDCDYDCSDCDCDYDCDDCDCTLADYVNEMFDGDWDLYESNMDDDD